MFFSQGFWYILLIDINNINSHCCGRRVESVLVRCTSVTYLCFAYVTGDMKGRNPYEPMFLRDFHGK